MPDYEIQEVLGRGAMGVVHRARDLMTGHDVAVKILRADLALIPATVVRFVREIDALRRLRHPNVIRILDAGQLGDRHFYAMELLHARPLDAILRADGSMPLPRTMALFRQAADALAYCHSNACIHRDVKPANLMVDDRDHLTLMDFGLAKLQGGIDVTTVGKLVGTPRFLAPEVITGSPPAAAADVYALGISLAETITGQPVVPPAAAITAILRMIVLGGSIQVAFPPDIPDALRDLVDRMIAREPDQRPAASAVVATLDALRA